MTSVYVLLISERRPTDFAPRKISNGHISAAGHPMHFVLGSSVRYSWSADETAPALDFEFAQIGIENKITDEE